MAIIRFFKMTAAAMLDFQNFKFATVGAVKRVKLRHCAKCCRNCSNRGGDMAIFRFFQDGGHPTSWIWDACVGPVGTTHEWHLVVYITVQIAKFGWNRCSSFNNMHVFHVFRFAVIYRICKTFRTVERLTRWQHF